MGYWTSSILSGSGLKPLGKKYLFCYLMAVYNGGDCGEDYADLNHVLRQAAFMVTPPSNISSTATAPPLIGMSTTVK